MPPEGNAPFDFLRSRDVVAQAQVQGVLHGVVKARCAKQRARTQGGVQVIPDAVHARARARAGESAVESAVCHAAHGVHEVLRMAFAVLPLQRHGIPQPAVQPRSQAGRKLLAAVVVIHGVLPVAVAVVFEAGRCLKALGLALGHHDGDAHRIARINGGKRTVERIHALQRLHIHHAPARRVKAAQKVGNQIAIQIHQAAPRLQRAVAAAAHHGVAVAKVALAQRNAGQTGDGVFRIEHVLRAQLLARTAGGAAAPAAIQPGTAPDRRVFPASGSVFRSKFRPLKMPIHHGVTGPIAKKLIAKKQWFPGRGRRPNRSAGKP